MNGYCPYCGNHLPRHGACCRVPDDLDRMERVHAMLAHSHRNDFLQHKLEDYLIEFGRLAEPG